MGTGTGVGSGAGVVARRPEAKPRCPGGCGRAGSEGDGCALPSAGGGHGAPRRLPAPPRPRPPQRPLLAGAGAAPAGRRLPSRPAVRPSPAPRSEPRSALRAPPPAGACPAPAGGRRGCEKRQSSAAPSQGARSAALPSGVRPVSGGCAGSRGEAAVSAGACRTQPVKAPGTRTHLPRRLQQRCPTGWVAVTAVCAGGGRDVGHGEPWYVNGSMGTERRVGFVPLRASSG